MTSVTLHPFSSAGVPPPCYNIEEREFGLLFNCVTRAPNLVTICHLVQVEREGHRQRLDLNFSLAKGKSAVDIICFVYKGRYEIVQTIDK